MAELKGSDGSVVGQFQNEVPLTWLPDLEHLPLIKRVEVLLARNTLTDFLSDIHPVDDADSNWAAEGNGVVLNEDYSKTGDSQEKMIARVASEQSQTAANFYSSNGVELKDCNQQLIEVNQMTAATVTLEKAKTMDVSSLQQPLVSKHTDSGKVKYSDRSSLSPSGNSEIISPDSDLPAIKIGTERTKAFHDDLDHVTLIERQILLLPCLKLHLIDSSPEGNEFRSTGNRSYEIRGTSNSDSSKCINPVLPCEGGNQGNNKSTDLGSVPVVLEKCGECPSNHNFSSQGASIGKTHIPSNTTKAVPALEVNTLGDNQMMLDKVPVVSLPLDDMAPMKSGLSAPDDSAEDKLDHMLLSHRMKLMTSVEVPHSDAHGVEFFSEDIRPVSNSQPKPVTPECIYPFRNNRGRKKRRTATDSVETALEEDAPGLLQVLVEKGVSIDEMKLYGEPECDEALDDLSNEESFTDLGAVISKIFWQKNSFFKLPPLRSTKNEKASYCLACLFSLVEQARYLRFRKWPVEWGWCRDLQAFIFLFQRHNRIVLERPEYGYATYFFELVDFLPVNWQIKRLVIAMKLTSCSRITLIENKSLVTGEDLSEEEAKVLMEYGWMPNTGLGTMLNYCDRVVHDRKNEKDTSEWRSKIGKLLADGYNGGTIVPTEIPKKLMEPNLAQSSQIKLELV